jgi:hypothetical protein
MSDHTPLSSDHLLTRLRIRCEHLTLVQNIRVTKDQLLALVECAEALREVNKRLYAATDCKCTDCEGIRRAEAALAKLEAL